MGENLQKSELLKFNSTFSSTTTPSCRMKAHNAQRKPESSGVWGGHVMDKRVLDWQSGGLALALVLLTPVWPWVGRLDPLGLGFQV